MIIKNIIVDLGHGGIDNNGNYVTSPAKMATLPDGTVVYEGVINRQIGGLVGQLLKWHTEFNIEYTVKPDDYRDISLHQRVRVANKYNPNETLFVSIHSNAFNGSAMGFEIYTTRGITKSDDLAESIANRVEILYSNINLNLRYDFSDGDKDKEADFYVLRKTKCTAVLIECLFFDNEYDYKYLSNTKFQKDLAYAIYKGIIDYASKI